MLKLGISLRGWVCLQTVLITGASKGIGADCALEFAKEGYFVIINYFKSKKEAFNLVDEIRKFNGNAEAIYGDVSKEAEVEKIYFYIKQKNVYLKFW